MTALFDVIAVNIKTGVERVLAENRTRANAEATLNLAVMRRGVKEESYKIRQASPRIAES
jgi:hypothetical protein